MFITKTSSYLKLVDFGSAHVLDAGSTVRVLLNTIEFCSPEVMSCDTVSFCSDLWSLGVLAFVM